MSDADDELESIRKQKRERLTARANDADEQVHAETDEPVHVESAGHFRELVDEGVALIDFYADWCGPCKMLEPTVAELAAETAATVAKVDIDAHQDLAAEYQVQGVPTLYLFADGEPVERMVGVQDKGTLVELVRQYSS